MVTCNGCQHSTKCCNFIQLERINRGFNQTAVQDEISSVYEEESTLSNSYELFDKFQKITMTEKFDSCRCQQQPTGEKKKKIYMIRKSENLYLFSGSKYRFPSGVSAGKLTKVGGTDDRGHG